MFFKNDKALRSWLSIPLILVFTQGLALAQDEQTIEEIYVEGSRLPANIRSFPGSVTLLSAEDLSEQAVISSDLGRILSAIVPGMAPSARDGNNFAQTVRGRKPAFFIDGIPQSAALRGGGRDLRIIHANALERIEVIRGSTAIYGLGGSGGVVNYITKRPGEEGIQYYTEVAFTASPTEFDSDGNEYNLTQGIAGKTGNFDYVGNITYQTRGLFADADGDFIPPDPNGQTGIADMDELSVFLKGGWNISDRLRWDFTFLNYDAEVDTDYTVAQGSFANDQKSIAEIKRQNNIALGPFVFDFIGEVDPSNENTLLATSLNVDDILGSSARFQLFSQELDLVWRHLDFLGRGVGGFPGGSQLTTKTEKQGARIDINTPVTLGAFENAFVLWGMDYTIDETRERLVDGRDRSNAEQTSLSFFAQLQLNITERLHVSGGIRYDDFELDVASLQVPDTGILGLFHSVIGTTIDYDNVAGNLGFVYDFTDNLSFSAAWSNGFSIGNVLRTIGQIQSDVVSPTPVELFVSDLGQFTEAVEVDSYEAGFRYVGERFSGSITYFESESDLGATFDPITLELSRAPEEISGIEVAGELVITDAIRFGGSYAELESKTDTDDNGSLDGELDFGRVPAPFLLTYLEVDFMGSWTARIQASTIFDEERFERPFGSFQRDIEGYTIVDLSVSGAVWNGTLSIGVENLANKQYTPVSTLMGCSDSPVFDAFCNVAAPGARATLRYSIDY